MLHWWLPATVTILLDHCTFMQSSYYLQFYEKVLVAGYNLKSSISCTSWCKQFFMSYMGWEQHSRDHCFLCNNLCMQSWHNFLLSASSFLLLCGSFWVNTNFEDHFTFLQFTYSTSPFVPKMFFLQHICYCQALRFWLPSCSPSGSFKLHFSFG
jgi:hypothetical protein